MKKSESKAVNLKQRNKETKKLKKKQRKEIKKNESKAVNLKERKKERKKDDFRYIKLPLTVN